MLTDFNLVSELHEKALVIRIEGYINNAGGEKIVQEFSRHNVNKLILNLEKSTAINSIGISHLIEIIERLEERKGKLIFTNLDATVEKTLTIMGLFKFAEKADSVEAALNS